MISDSYINNTFINYSFLSNFLRYYMQILMQNSFFSPQIYYRSTFTPHYNE